MYFSLSHKIKVMNGDICTSHKIEVINENISKSNSYTDHRRENYKLNLIPYVILK